MTKFIFFPSLVGFVVFYCEIFSSYPMLCLIGSLIMMFYFKFNVANMISLLYCNYLYLDKWSYSLVLLKLWILSLMYLSLDKSDKIKELTFVVMLFILLMFFCKSNLMMMYLFFELSLIPTYLMIVYWGSTPGRISASFYLLIYMLLLIYMPLISLPLLFYRIQLLYYNWMR